MLRYFDEIIGYESIKSEIERICNILNEPEKYKNLNVIVPKTLLLYGPPGVGKTEIAKCIAKEIDRELLICRKNKPDGEFVSYINAIFENAEKLCKGGNRCCILLDDFDRYANDDERHRNSEEYITIQSCLDKLESKDIFVIGTANSLLNIPDSLLRPGRFGLSLNIEKPNGEDSEKIVKHFLDKIAYVKDVDGKLIARMMEGYSCAELQDVVNKAAIYAGFEGKEYIDMDDMTKACISYLYEPADVVIEDNQYFRQVCYHEAAHCLVNEYYEPGSVNIISIGKNANNNLTGVTSHYQDPNYFNDISFMEARIKSLLAGKAATEIVFNKSDSGATADIKRAYKIATRIVDDYCAYGFNYWEGAASRSSDALLERKESKINELIQSYYTEVKELLIENRDYLDELANELMNKRTLTQIDIKKIRNRI